MSKIVRNILILGIGIVLLAGLGGVASSASAQERRSGDIPTASDSSNVNSQAPSDNYLKSIKIDGKVYSRDWLIWAFIETAISRYLVFDSYESPELNVLNAKYGNVINDDNPYVTDSSNFYETSLAGLSEYIYRSDGLPQPFVINKWLSDPTIGIDWQKSQTNGGEILGLGFSTSEHPESDEVYTFFEDQIRRNLPILESITGLHIKLIRPSEEKTASVARVRIVPVRYPKKSPYKKKLATDALVVSTETELVTAVPFTSAYDDHVDGFFVPNSDNSIGFAVCKINIDLPDNEIQSLITECLWRVMGLPEVLPIDHASILATSHLNDDDNQAGKYVSDYDRFFLSILYCKLVQNGMNLYEVVRVLKRDSSCFNNSIDKIGESK